MTDECSDLRLDLEGECYRCSRSGSGFFFKKELKGFPVSGCIDISGPRWAIGIISLEGSDIRLDGQSVREFSGPGEEAAGIYIPAFSVYESSGGPFNASLSLYIHRNPDPRLPEEGLRLFKTGVRNFAGGEDDILALASDAAAAFGRLSDPDPPDVSETAREVKRLLDSSYSEIGKLSDLARTLGVPGWRLSRLFKQGYGLSPLKYLNNLRSLDAVYNLLEEGGRVSDAAFNSGFRDLSRFNKEFLKFLRFVPRRLIKKD